MMFLGMALGLYFRMHFHTFINIWFHLKDAKFLKLFEFYSFYGSFLAWNWWFFLWNLSSIIIMGNITRKLKIFLTN